MNAHDAANEMDDLDIVETQFAKLLSNADCGGVMAQGLHDIRVRRGTAAEQPAEHRNQQSQISKIKRTPERIVRFAELEDEQSTTGSQHSMQLPQSILPTGKIS